MAIGDGTIGRAIQVNTQQQEQSVMNREARRSNKVREALAQEGMTDQTRRTDLLELEGERRAKANTVNQALSERQVSSQERTGAASIAYNEAQTEMQGAELQLKKDEMYLAQKPQQDAIAQTYYASVGDFDSQQAELLIKKTETAKNLRKTGLSAIQAASSPMVQEIEMQLETLEKSRSAFIEGYESNDQAMRALAMSGPGMGQAILSRSSPFALSKMSDEEAAAYAGDSKSSHEVYMKNRREQEAYENDLQARQMAEAEGAKAKAKSDAVQANELEQIRETYGARAEIAEQTAIGKAQADIYEDDVESTMGTVENTVRAIGLAVNNMLPQSGGDYKLLGEKGFATDASKYYKSRPEAFQSDMQTLNIFMDDFSANHGTVKWMTQSYPAALKFVKNNMSTDPNGIVPNPLGPMLGAMTVLGENAPRWGKDARKYASKIAISWINGKEKAAPAPEAASLPAGL